MTKREPFDFDLRDGGILLQKTDLPFENKGVLNPTCVENDGFVHMFYRAVGEGDISSIGCAVFDKEHKPLTRNNRPVLVPEHEYESRGVEDPRIIFLDGIYYLFYTAFDGIDARVAYAESKDLITFEKKGLISPSKKYSEVLTMLDRNKLPEKYFWYGEHYQEVRAKDVLVWDKDFLLFPRKIGGKFAFLHRIMPGIQLVTVDSFEQFKDPVFWDAHLRSLDEHIVFNPELWFESKKVGAGAPPIETPYGWLLIYHAVEEETKTYRAGAALLDLDNPRKVIGKLREPLFSPTETWEKKGIVGNVVFPTAALVHGNRLVIYYGAADDCIAYKTLDMQKLVKTLVESSRND